MSKTILFIGLSQSLFGAFVLITKRRVEISDRILIACLLTFAVKFMVFSLYLEHSEYFDLEFSMGMIPLTFGPYLYLYTRYLVDRVMRFNYADLLHFVPFLLLTFIYFAFFKDRVNFSDVQYFNNDKFLWIRVVYGLIFFTSIVTYTVLTFIKLRQYRKGITAYFSYWTRQLRLLWLNFIPTLFFLLFITYFITGAINAFSFKKVVDTDTLSHIGLTIIAFAVSYFGLRQPTLYKRVRIKEDFQREKLKEEQADDEDEEDTKKQKARFTDEEANVLIEKLNNYMLEEKPYLNPELTLYDLASPINMTKNELTDLLNNHIGKNFFSYVNEYRINAVIKRFKNPDYQHFTIIAIAYDCGFNSKSTFNSLFKQHIGKTPSDYKKELNLV